MDGGVGEREGVMQERGRDWQECETSGQEGDWWVQERGGHGRERGVTIVNTPSPFNEPIYL